jgi:hypothetical protein
LLDADPSSVLQHPGAMAMLLVLGAVGGGVGQSMLLGGLIAKPL